MPATLEEPQREAVLFALANLTGKGFSGDLGYASAARLGEEASLGEARAHDILESLVAGGMALSDGSGGYSGLAAHCLCCGDVPCTCGLGTWR
jgi:hypothetical protein